MRVHVEGRKASSRPGRIASPGGHRDASELRWPESAGCRHSRLDERGFIRVNERLETNIAGVYALGDIKGGPAFTHISYDDFRIIRPMSSRRRMRRTKDRQVPYTVFIDPQLGRVGLTETEARAQGRKIRVAKMPMTHVARAIEVDETRGFMKAIVDADYESDPGRCDSRPRRRRDHVRDGNRDDGKLPYTALRDGIFAHPTLAESLNNLFMAMDKS